MHMRMHGTTHFLVKAPAVLLHTHERRQEGCTPLHKITHSKRLTETFFFTNDIKTYVLKAMIHVTMNSHHILNIVVC